MSGLYRALGATRRSIAWGLRASAAESLVGKLDRRDRRRHRSLAVLMFHRIDRAERRPELEPRLISSGPERFEQIVAYLARTRPVISLADLLTAKRTGTELAPGSVLLTFDDATEDFAEYAWPTLKRYGLPATVFVPTAYPGSGEPFWWDRLHDALTRTPRRGEIVDTPIGRLDLRDGADENRLRTTVRDWVWRTDHDRAMAGIEALAAELGVQRASGGSVLDWDRLRALAAEGVTLAPHTRSHPCLDRLPLKRALAEVEASIDDLKREIGTSAPAFAYPAGAFSDELVARLPQLGIEAAFTTVRGVASPQLSDPLRIRRIGVGQDDSPAFIVMMMMPPVAHVAWRLRTAQA